jgi:hypothetical protein
MRRSAIPFIKLDIIIASVGYLIHTVPGTIKVYMKHVLGKNKDSKNKQFRYHQLFLTAAAAAVPYSSSSSSSCSLGQPWDYFSPQLLETFYAPTGINTIFDSI